MIKFEGQEWNLTITRNMSFWHQCLSDKGHYWNSKDFGVDVKLKSIFLTINGTETSVFREKENYKKYCKAILGAVNSERKINLLKVRYKKYAATTLDSLKICNRNLNVKTINKFIKEYQRFGAGLMVTATLGRVGGEFFIIKFLSLNKNVVYS